MSGHSPASNDFEALIAQIAAGSEAAVWELLARYSSNIRRVVRRSLPQEIRGKMDSADVVQSVWKSLFGRPDKLREISDVEQFVAYLVGMARFKVFEAHRRYTDVSARDVRREVPLSERDTAAQGDAPRRELPDWKALDPSDIAAANECWNLALAQEGDRGRHIVELRLTGLTHGEIAQRLSIGESTVRRVLASLLQSVMR
jgi:RNA polymerase sigma factor (sigma-70 family)